MPIEKKNPEEKPSPIMDESFRKPSLDFGNLLNRRQFEQNLVKFGIFARLASLEARPVATTTIIETTVEESSDSPIDYTCHWKQVNEDVYYDEGDVYIRYGLGLSTYLDLTETPIPSTPEPNVLRLYVEDFKGFSFFSFKDDTGMVRKIVRDSVFVGKNVTGTTIPASAVVYASGSSEGVPTIALARSNSSTTMPAIGVTIESIANNAFGRVMQVGLLENVPTIYWPSGTVLYVSATIPGFYDSTPPTYPNIRQEVVTILVSDASAGSAQVIARSMFYDSVIDHAGLFHLAYADSGHTGFEPALGNPGADGYVLSSTMAGVRSWIAPSGGSGAPADAQYIVGTANATLSAEKVKAQLYRNYDIDDTPSSPNAMDDEFDDSSLDVKWTIVNNPSSPNAVSETAYVGYLWVGLPELTTDDFDHLIRVYQTPPSGSVAWTFIIKASVGVQGLESSTDAGEFTGVGVYVGTLADDQLVATIMQYNDAAGDYVACRLQGQNDMSVPTFNNYQLVPTGGSYYLKLEKATTNAYTSANTYNMYYSFNGITWYHCGQESKTFTHDCDELGIVFRAPKAQGGTPIGYGIVDFFRRTV